MKKELKQIKNCQSYTAYPGNGGFKLQTVILLLEAIIGQTYKANKKIHLRTIHHNKRKALKERTKGKGSLLWLRSSRNAENGTKTAILWDKRCFGDLVMINYRVKS